MKVSFIYICMESFRYFVPIWLINLKILISKALYPVNNEYWDKCDSTRFPYPLAEFTKLYFVYIFEASIFIL